MDSQKIFPDDIIWIDWKSENAHDGMYWMVLKISDETKLECASLKNGKRTTIIRSDVLAIYRLHGKNPFVS